MPDTVIRPGQAADAPALTACIAKAYAPWMERLTTLPDVTGGVADNLRTKAVFVAEVGGIVAGGVVADLSDRQGGRIENLAVSPEFAGRGLGRALLTRIGEQARQLGIRRLCLTTHSDMSETLAFYRGLGWSRTGRDGHRVFLEKPVEDEGRA